jgi:hypothetical protein
MNKGVFDNNTFVNQGQEKLGSGSFTEDPAPVVRLGRGLGV